MISVTSAFAFHIGELNINNKDIEAQARLDMGQFNHQVDPHTTFIGMRYLSSSKDHSDYHKDPQLFELNALLQKEVSSLPALRLGIGVRYEYVDVDDVDFSAIPLGVEVAYRLPSEDFIPMHLGGSFYYSPEVLSFGDAKHYLEYKINLDFEIIDNGFITIGYRHIDTRYQAGNSENLNAGFLFGFKVFF